MCHSSKLCLLNTTLYYVLVCACTQSVTTILYSGITINFRPPVRKQQKALCAVQWRGPFFVCSSPCGGPPGHPPWGPLAAVGPPHCGGCGGGRYATDFIFLSCNYFRVSRYFAAETSLQATAFFMSSRAHTLQTLVNHLLLSLLQVLL